MARHTRAASQTKPPSSLCEGAYYSDIKEIFRILKKSIRDSHKGHFLGGSHFLPLFPKNCDCITSIEKNVV